MFNLHSQVAYTVGRVRRIDIPSNVGWSSPLLLIAVSSCWRPLGDGHHVHTTTNWPTMVEQHAGFISHKSHKKHLNSCDEIQILYSKNIPYDSYDILYRTLPKFVCNTDVEKPIHFPHRPRESVASHCRFLHLC